MPVKERTIIAPSSHTWREQSMSTLVSALADHIEAIETNTGASHTVALMLAKDTLTEWIAAEGLRPKKVQVDR